jgi:phage gpG-like protein
MFMIKVVGVNYAMRKNEARKKKLANNQKMLMQQLALVDRWVQKNFQSEGKKAVGGTGWKALSPATILAREKGWGQYVKSMNPRILQNKGDLRNRWEHRITNRMGVLRSKVDYGVPHDQGLGNLPKRPILPTTEQIRPELKKHAKWFIKQGLK